MKALITCGPTWVAIDDVRVISNRSTGEMGRLIAGQFKKAGAKVTMLEGPMSFDDFAAALSKESAKKYDIVVHAAAVSDFKPQRVAKTKIASEKPFSLKLVPTEKLVNRIKRASPGTFLVGFKLEPGLNEKSAFRASRKLFTDSGADVVVANSVTHGYKGYILDADGRVLAKASSKQQLAKKLCRTIANIIGINYRGN